MRSAYLTDLFGGGPWAWQFVAVAKSSIRFAGPDLVIPANTEMRLFNSTGAGLLDPGFRRGDGGARRRCRANRVLPSLGESVCDPNTDQGIGSIGLCSSNSARSRRFLRLYLLPPQKPFGDLFRHCRNQRETEHHSPFIEAHLVRVEYRVEEGHEHGYYEHQHGE
jgi:hypothetical protein